jgi:hypothetical protein
MVANSSFKVGGSLDGNCAFYVARAADQGRRARPDVGARRLLIS